MIGFKVRTVVVFNPYEWETDNWIGIQPFHHRGRVAKAVWVWPDRKTIGLYYSDAFYKNWGPKEYTKCLPASVLNKIRRRK